MLKDGFNYTLNCVPEFGPILANTAAAKEEEKTNAKSTLTWAKKQMSSINPLWYLAVTDICRSPPTTFINLTYWTHCQLTFIMSMKDLWELRQNGIVLYEKEENKSLLPGCMFLPKTVFEMIEVILIHTDFKIESNISN